MMNLRRGFVAGAIAAALICLGSCGGDDGGTGPDVSAPAAVTDLVVTAVTETTLTLGWSASGDDGSEGTAAAYDLRWSTGSLSEAAWPAATPVTGLPDPKAAGSSESFTVTGLDPGTLYSVALKVLDEVGNASGLSNVASDTTSEEIVPDAPILDVHPTRMTFGTLIDSLDLRITNTGTGTLSWSLAANESWLSASPESGTTTAETDTVTVAVDRSGWDAGDHSGTVTVTPQNGDPRDVTVTMTVVPPPVVEVQIDTDSTDVEAGQTFQFNAVVTGAEDQSVTWSVEEGAGYGTVDGAGLYTAPSSVPVPPTATVRATSNADPSKYDTARVRIVIPTPAGFARVSAGSFEMGGDSRSQCGQTAYPVTLTEDFFLGRKEVTNRQFMEMAQWAYDHGYVTANEDSLVDATGGGQLLMDLSSPLCEIKFTGGAFGIRNAGHGAYNVDHPVIEASWYGAAAYCNWLSLKEGFEPAYDPTTWTCNGGDPYRAEGYRLPTDAEWEYAAQYDDGRDYPWGNNLPSCQIANFAPCTSDWTEPVGNRPAEKVIGGRGLHDMGGNVWEWCNDWFQCAPNPSPVDPAGPAGLEKVLHGGCWTDYETPMRCAYRMGYAPEIMNIIYGFRVARTAEP